MVTVCLTKIGNWIKLCVTYRYNRLGDFQETKIMDELQKAMLDFVVSQGGTTTWQELVDALPAQSRSQIPRAFAVMRAEKTLQRGSEYNPETGLSPLKVWKV